MADRVMLDSSAANHIQAYINYHNLVGDNGGKLLSEKEYADFQKNYAEKSKNRIYCSWRNTKGLDCKLIGPASMCFCGHRFKEHEILEPKHKKVYCKQQKCSCPSFNHVPVFGSHDLKCLCKHSYTEHDPITKKCIKGQCGCNRFGSTWSCSCGLKYGEHQTITETRQERISQGKAVDNGDSNAPYMPGGGVPTFASLASGADRFEYKNEQSIGPPSQQRMIQPKQQQQSIEPKQPLRDRSKLGQMNQKISHDQYEQQQQYQQQQFDDDDDQQNQQQQNQYGQQRVQNQVARQEQPDRTLLNLFQTPHIYGSMQMPAKQQRQLKY